MARGLEFALALDAGVRRHDEPGSCGHITPKTRATDQPLLQPIALPRKSGARAVAEAILRENRGNRFCGGISTQSGGSPISETGRA
jgi:hypothetical protein